MKEIIVTIRRQDQRYYYIIKHEYGTMIGRDRYINGSTAQAAAMECIKLTETEGKVRCVHEATIS